MEILNSAQYEEYEQFVQRHRAGNFMQSIRWTKVKYNWDFEVVVSRGEDGAIQGSMLILIQKVPIFSRTFLYSPRGPVCDFHNEAVLADLLNGVKAVAKKHKGYMFRMDPYVLEGDDEFVKIARHLGFEHTPYLEDFGTIQTRNNYMIAMEGKSAEEVFAGFHSKWRYNVRVAEKHGVECRVMGPEGIDDFYQLMQITGERDHFLPRSKEYFLRILDAFGEHARLYNCYYEGRPVSAALALQYSRKTIYLYGASGNEDRKVMPNHLMQWSMIQWAAEGDSIVYDFQGIPLPLEESNPRYGVYRFKKGFGGTEVLFAGEFDYVFSPSFRRLVLIGEKMLKISRTIQNRLKNGKQKND